MLRRSDAMRRMRELPPLDHAPGDKAEYGEPCEDNPPEKARRQIGDLNNVVAVERSSRIIKQSQLSKRTDRPSTLTCQPGVSLTWTYSSVG